MENNVKESIEEREGVKGQWASLVPQMIKNLSAMQETGVRSLDQEDHMEKGMATDDCI